MEYALRGGAQSNNHGKPNVLILVLMEYALRVTCTSDKKETLMS